jgi:hypothetical protein
MLKMAIALGVVVVSLLAVWLLTRDPSPESEAERYFSSRSLDEIVRVVDCRWSEDDSVTNMYECHLVAARPVAVPHGGSFPAGSVQYCFLIPRGDRGLLGDRDELAIPVGVAGQLGC